MCQFGNHARREPYSGYPQFRSPGALAGAMRQVGIDVAVAANNHICDRGGAGIRSTLDTLVQAGLEYTGYSPIRFLIRPATRWLRKGDFRVALLNYTYGNQRTVRPARLYGEPDRYAPYQAGYRRRARQQGDHVVLFSALGQRVRDVAESLAARLGRPEPSLGGRSGDRFASARRSVGRNGIRFVGQDLRGDRFFDGQFCFEPAFSRYGRRHIGADRAVARRRRADGLPSRVPDSLDVDLIRPGESLGASLRDRSGPIPAKRFRRNNGRGWIASSGGRGIICSVTVAALPR